MNKKLKNIFEDTCKILKDNKNENLGEDVKKAIKNTTIINMDKIKSYVSEEKVPIKIELSNKSSIDEALRQACFGEDVIVLNFASAISPGGGVKTGATAQEESLCRVSALYNCLKEQGEFYSYHKRHRNYLYNNHIIYSPNVPVIKDNEGVLLDEHSLISFITSPAVYAKYARILLISNQKINSVMEDRINKMIDFIIEKSPDCVILGAFGCGVFKNNPIEVARMFKTAINARSKAINDKDISIVFAIYDKDKTGHNYKTFEKILKEDTCLEYRVKSIIK